MDLSRLHRYGLGVWPTPLHRSPRLERALGIEGLYLKRDDLSGFGLGGNKVRKLEFMIGDALAQDADVIVVMGGPQSNLCQTAAMAARVAGLRCELVLYGSCPPTVPASLALAVSAGAAVVYTDDPERESVEVAAEKRAAELSADGHRPYLIPRGGSTAVGAAGYHLAVGEVAHQLEDLGVAPEAMVVTVGSGGTIAGLVSGIGAAAHQWRVVGVSVSRPLDEVERRMWQLARECSTLLGSPSPQPGAVELIDARHPGFGFPSPAGDEVSLAALVLEGVLLDPVYTAKSMAAVAGLADRGPVLWWHTGGVAAALTHMARGYA